MGRENTGRPWVRGFADLESGRPAYPAGGRVTGNFRVLDRYGQGIDYSRMEEQLYDIGETLEAILVVLNDMNGTNINKEDI